MRISDWSSDVGSSDLSASPSTRSDIPKREGILDAATRVFLARGFEDTSMDLVAREASVARRTVYNQFESKEALFIASVERVWSEFPVLELTADESVLSDPAAGLKRSEEHTSELQSLMRISYAVFC